MDSAVAQVSEVTGADAATARFFLDAAGGNVEAAITSLLEGGGAIGAGAGGGVDDLDDDEMDELPAGHTAPAALPQQQQQQQARERAPARAVCRTRHAAPSRL